MEFTPTFLSNQITLCWFYQQIWESKGGRRDESQASDGPSSPSPAFIGEVEGEIFIFLPWGLFWQKPLGATNGS
jgi:hypothetical protein